MDTLGQKGAAMRPCVSDAFPQAAIDAMVRESGAPRYDDGHTDCYYAGLLLAALPHLTAGDLRIPEQFKALNES